MYLSNIREMVQLFHCISIIFFLKYFSLNSYNRQTIILLRWNNTNLDDSQKDGVRFALKQRELAIIHGPPGLQSSLHPPIRIFLKGFLVICISLGSSKRLVFKQFKVQLVTYFNNRFLFLTVKEGTRENILTLSCLGVSKILYQTGDMHKFLQIFSCYRGWDNSPSGLISFSF